MGCFHSKVAPFPTPFRTKKQQRRLRKILKKNGIKANVSRGGVAFVIPVTGGGETMWSNVSFLKTRLQRNDDEDEVASKRKKELVMIEKQERARERRDEIERRRKEKLRRQSLHRQNSYKLSVMFQLLEILQ